MQKTCKVCQTTKDISEFHVIDRKTGKTRAICKECRKAEQRAWYSENVNQIRAYRSTKYPRKKERAGRLKNFESCEKSKTDDSHVWYRCKTCFNEYARDHRRSKKTATPKTIRPVKTGSKFCQCEVPVLLMKNSENGIHAYCKTCIKPTKI